MSKSWPPSPMVEDEVISLAKEHCTDSTVFGAGDGIPPPESRGAVDQYPLIIDLDEQNNGADSEKRDGLEKAQRQNSQTGDWRKSPSSETRFVHIPMASAGESEIPHFPRPLRSKSSIGIAADEDSRGRPQISRINTDLGADLHSMATGQRRAPSPYSYRVSTSTLLPSLLDDQSKVSLLSPQAAAALPLPSANRRGRSQRPERVATKVEGSDSDGKRADYGRRRSKSRHDRGSFSRSSGDERTAFGRTERPRYESRKSQLSPLRGEQRNIVHRAAHGNITPPQTPGHPKESPYTSAAEDSDRRRHHERRRAERRLSKESPYASAAEERPSRREQEDRYFSHSRRQSMHRPGKLPLDLPNQSVRPETGTPISGRTSRTLEEDIEQAFKDNQKKQTRRYAPGDRISPFTSPPTSPPRTPRGERKSKDKDYFGTTAPVPNMSKQRSRPPSMSDNPIKPMTTLLSAATLGAASLAAKATPTNISRSSIASLETPSSGSQVSLANGPKSRKPSPVHDELRMSSRNSSTVSFDGVFPARPSVLPTHNERPVSRAGSVTSQDDGRSHSTTPSIHEERPASRNGNLHASVPTPPPTHRSSSYSTVPEQAHSRPSAHRTYSTLTGSSGAPKTTAQNRLPQSHLSQPPLIGPTYVNSPSGEKPLESLPIQSNTSSTLETTEKNTGTVGKDAKKQISFPVCPQPYPVTGVSSWYTISGLVNFDICSSCVHVLGESPIRVYCISSALKPTTEAVTCALSQPWVRIVIARCLKDGVTNLGLLQSLNSLPPDIYPCPGRQTEIRRWYHVIDPESKAPVPGFNVCTACVRNAELVFPELWKEGIFERPEGKLAQERYCNLFTGSKHFYGIVNQLDLLAGYSKKKDLRKKDISAFGDFVRKKARYRECVRDAMLATPLWHYMPSLPELTICEECYKEVVWPLSEKPIARDVTKTLQKVPIQRPAHYVAGISCQLYSDRMRKIFKDAINRNDFESLRNAALARYNIEHRLQEYHRRFELDQQQGYDRRADIEKNIAYWKQYE